MTKESYFSLGEDVGFMAINMRIDFPEQKLISDRDTI
jgi:hypothetical protein